MTYEYWYKQLINMRQQLKAVPYPVIHWIFRFNFIMGLESRGKTQRQEEGTEYTLEDHLSRWDPFCDLTEISPGIWTTSVGEELSAFLLLEEGKIVSHVLYGYSRGFLRDFEGKGRSKSSVKAAQLLLDSIDQSDHAQEEINDFFEETFMIRSLLEGTYGSSLKRSPRTG